MPRLAPTLALATVLLAASCAQAPAVTDPTPTLAAPAPPTPTTAAASPADGAQGAIQTAGMALAPPAAGENVDPSTFATTFPHTAPRIYLVYALALGTVTTVTFEWYQLGEFIFDDTFDWTATTTSGWAAIGPPSDGRGFQPGNYGVVMTLDTGESRALDFLIEGP